MKRVAITQRVEMVECAGGERRDALDQRWTAFLESAGLAPLVLPNCLEVAERMLAEIPVAGVLLTGGNDLGSYGGQAPERDRLELALVAAARAGRFPLVGVCRGMQVVLHAFGQPLEKVQDHTAVRHPVTFGGGVRTVNSYHNYGVRQVPVDFCVEARSDDGVVESIRHHSQPIFGLMWHPERESPFGADDILFFQRVFGLELPGVSKPAPNKAGTVYWITGLSGSGKTTVGRLFLEHLRLTGRAAVLLDGDEVREVLGNDLGHSADQRRLSAMRNSRLCRMLAEQAVDVVCCTISMFHECRNWNRSHIPHYREIYLKVPLEVLIARDAKGIYARALQGEIQHVYGVDLEFQEPERPDLVVVNDGHLNPTEVATQLWQSSLVQPEVRVS